MVKGKFSKTSEPQKIMKMVVAERHQRQYFKACLTCRMLSSYRKQSIDMLFKSIEWYQYVEKIVH